VQGYPDFDEYARKVLLESEKAQPMNRRNIRVFLVCVHCTAGHTAYAFPTTLQIAKCDPGVHQSALRTPSKQINIIFSHLGKP
jgi:hypothetical protein